MLAFESLEEVNIFAEMLRDEPSGQLEPVPTPTSLEQMSVAMQQAGIQLAIVPA